MVSNFDGGNYPVNNHSLIKNEPVKEMTLEEIGEFKDDLTSNDILRSSTIAEEFTDKKIPSLSASKVSGSTQKSRPAFVMKLWYMVNDNTNYEHIRWSPDGTSFKVVSRQGFMKHILSKYFKHSNFSSFVRQLNMYGWHKVQDVSGNNEKNISVTTTNSKLSKKNDDEAWQFENPFFQRGREDLLDKINRNKVGKISENPEIDANILVNELNRIRKAQSIISNNVRNIRSDNNLLWQEMTISRGKFDKHNETLNSILRFMSAMFQNQNMIRHDMNMEAGPYLEYLKNQTNDPVINTIMANSQVDPSALSMTAMNNNNLQSQLSNTQFPMNNNLNQSNNSDSSLTRSDSLPYQSSTSSIPSSSIQKDNINPIVDGSDDKTDHLHGDFQKAPENSNENFVIPTDNFTFTAPGIAERRKILMGDSPITPTIPHQQNGMVVNDGVFTEYKKPFNEDNLNDSPSRLGVVPNNLEISNNLQRFPQVINQSNIALETLETSINKQEESINNLTYLISEFLPNNNYQKSNKNFQDTSKDFNNDEYYNPSSDGNSSSSGTPITIPQLSGQFVDISNNSLSEEYSNKRSIIELNDDDFVDVLSLKRFKEAY